MLRVARRDLRAPFTHDIADLLQILSERGCLYFCLCLC